LLYYLFLTLYIIACFVLILFVLLQPGKSDAAAVFGGGANSSAFGPRGTQTVLAKITIGAAVVFFLIAFVFATVPSWGGGEKSVGEGVDLPAAATPAPEPLPPPAQAPAATPPPAATQPATGSTTTPATGGTNAPAPQTKQGTDKKPANK
jgi:preprotein translocase subunit SecG